MEELANDPGNEALARWNYTQQEWRSYIIWSQKKKSIFHYFFHFLNPFKKKRAPEITIRHDRVCIGEKHHPFKSDDHQLKTIGIIEGKTPRGNRHSIPVSACRNQQLIDSRLTIHDS